MGKTVKQKSPDDARAARVMRRTVKKNHATSTEPDEIPRNRKINNQRNKEKHTKTSDDDKKKASSSKETRESKKAKKFVRFRFQIDCVDPHIINPDELIQFLKNNMKIDGKKHNLNEVAMDRRNAHVNLLAKVDLKKKYLKHLTKKFLKKMKLRNFRVGLKNTRAYKIVLKK